MNANDNIIVARRLPVWLSVQEKRSIGLWLTPSDTYPVGHVFKMGTPVQIRYIGDTPVLGSSAINPNGLLYADSVMGEQGCTFAYVTRGELLLSATQNGINGEQIDYLKKRITFVYSEDEEKPDTSGHSCFSEGYWINTLAWLNAEPWANM